MTQLLRGLPAGDTVIFVQAPFCIEELDCYLVDYHSYQLYEPHLKSPRARRRDLIFMKQLKSITVSSYTENLQYIKVSTYMRTYAKCINIEVGIQSTSSVEDTRAELFMLFV